MSRLLHIEASPRKTRSTSLDVAREFLDAYQAANPRDEIESWDLWDTSLPEFDGATIDAKYKIMHGEGHSADEAQAWGAVTRVFARFNAADKYLLSVPMWNFGIPYKLKHLIDVITQPGLAFSFSPETGFEGLVKNKPATVIYARGGDYSSNAQMGGLDFQKRYLDTLLGFIGFTQVRSIVAEPTLGGPAEVSSARESAKAAARELAAEF